MVMKGARAAGPRYWRRSMSPPTTARRWRSCWKRTAALGGQSGRMRFVNAYVTITSGGGILFARDRDCDDNEP